MLKIANLEGASNPNGLRAIVQSCEVRVTKNKKEYLSGFLMDDTGVIGFKVWDNADLMKTLLQPASVIRIESGKMDSYNDIVTIAIVKLTALSEDEGSDLIHTAPIEFDVLKTKFENTIEKLKEAGFAMDVGMGRLKTAGYLDLFMNLPAGRVMHHAYRHGLLQHSIEVVEIAESIMEHTARYHEADPDQDVVRFAALFHDLGKLQEYDITPLKLFDSFSTEGKLLGHHYISAEMINALFRKDIGQAFPDKFLKIKHCLLSHHGRKDWGAAVEPALLEAFIVSQADLISSAPFKFL